MRGSDHGQRLRTVTFADATAVPWSALQPALGVAKHNRSTESTKRGSPAQILEELPTVTHRSEDVIRSDQYTWAAKFWYRNSTSQVIQEVPRI